MYTYIIYIMYMGFKLFLLEKKHGYKSFKNYFHKGPIKKKIQKFFILNTYFNNLNMKLNRLFS